MSQPPSVPLVRLFQSALAKCRQSSFLKAVHRKTHGWCLGRGKVPCSCQRHCSRSRCGWNFFWRAKCCSSCQGTWFDGSRLWHWKQPWGWYLHRLWNGKGSNFSGQAKKKWALSYGRGVSDILWFVLQKQWPHQTMPSRQQFRLHKVWEFDGAANCCPFWICISAWAWHYHGEPWWKLFLEPARDQGFA